MSVGYIASTVPAKVVHASGTTLFHIAMKEANDALQWAAIARLNKMTDPWITVQQDVLIPPVLPNGPQTGILGL